MTKPSRQILTAVVGLLGQVLLTAVCVAQQRPPVAAVRPVNDDYFGTKVTDNYRWMEDMKSPELAEWMKAQNAYTREILQSLPGRAELLSEIEKYDNARTIVLDFQSYGGRYFYRKLPPGEENYKLYMRDAKSGQETLLVDPARFQPAGEKAHYALDYYQASWDGRFVAYGVSPGGSENSVMHIMDMETKRDFPETIDRTQYPNVSWLPDNRSFFYMRLQKLGPNDPPTAKYLNAKNYLHKVGEDPDKDVLVLARGSSPAVVMSESDFPFIGSNPASPWLVAAVVHGVQNEFSIYVAKRSDLNGAQTPWKKVVDDADDVTSLDYRGDSLYLLTHHQASRFKVVEIDLKKPDMSAARTLLSPGEAVLQNIKVAKDGLYIQQLDGGIGRMARISFDGGKTEQAPLPFDGSIGDFFTDPREPGAMIESESWVQPAQYLAIAGTQPARDLKLIPKPTFDYSGYESVEVKAPAADGTMIPLSIVYKKGLVKDSSHPTHLFGYGSYGITMNPAFLARRFPWLERGGVFAMAHIRGGGEYGEDWHNAGRKLTKQNTIGDFTACAEYLVKNKYTSPAKLAGEGGSAGGITVGGAITQRPDLFAVILDDVGLSDALRFETSPNGPPNVPEFGSTQTEEGYKGLYGMSAYAHVKDGTAYPAVMLTTGINDPRVDSWQAAKMAARLQAATSSDKPILLRVDYDAGHGMGSGRTQRDQELADQLSFALWQFGDLKFQPAKAPAAKTTGK